MYNQDDPRQKDGLNQEQVMIEYFQGMNLNARLTPELQFQGVDIEVTDLIPGQTSLLDVKSVHKCNQDSFCLPYISEEGHLRGVFRPNSKADFALVVNRIHDKKFLVKASELRDRLEKARQLCAQHNLTSSQARSQFNTGLTFFTEKGVRWVRFYYDNLPVQEV